MQILRATLQILIAVGLLNVWLLRFNQSTDYRGGSARTLREEFAAYGLPVWFVFVMGTLKIGASIALIVGLWFPGLVLPSAALISVLMLGALAMHLKVRDPLKKSLPALAILTLSLAVCLL